VVEDLVLSSKELADVMQFLGGWEIFEKSGNSDPYILPAKIFKVVGDWLSDARGAMVTQPPKTTEFFTLAHSQ